MGRGPRPPGTSAGRFVGLVWTGGPGIALGRLLAAGALLWLVYALVWLTVEGPVLDESAIAAPVITGDAGYPAGHPNAVLYRHAVLLFYQLGALQWRLYPDPWWISATRNVLFLFLSTFVPFLVVVACTRRPAWGHVAAVLTLSETTCSAVGVYLMWVFPGVYSSGHLGIHVAVLAVTLVAAGMPRTGGFLVGLLPAVHATMVLVAWPAALGAMLLRARHGHPLRPIAVSALAGLAAAATVAGAVAWNSAGDVAATPYETRADGTAILRTFTHTTDPHRQPLPMRSPLGLVGPTAFVALAGVALAAASSHRAAALACAGVLLVGAAAWSIALGTRALQALAGDLPLAVLMAMPGRLANIGMLLTVPLAVVVVALVAPARTAALLATLLVAVEGVLLVLAPHLAFAQLLYVVLGVALGAAVGCAGGAQDVAPAMHGAGTARRRRLLAIAASVAVALALALVRAVDERPPLPGFLLAFAAALAVSALVPASRRVPRPLAAALAAACVVVALVAVRGPHPANVLDFGSERQSAEETALSAWLAAHAAPHAMLLVPLFPPTWMQPKTGRPALVDAITLLSMTYFPHLAEPVARLLRDVYEVDYTDPAALAPLLGPDGLLRPSSPVWTRTWSRRSCAAWYDIGQRYGVELVLVPRTTALELPRVWDGATWALYRIPHDPASCAATARS